MLSSLSLGGEENKNGTRGVLIDSFDYAPFDKLRINRAGIDN
jgi:hypothetical protein